MATAKTPAVKARARATEHAGKLAELLAANWDLADRLQALGARAVYDAEYDLLYVPIGEPAEAITDSIDNVVGLRVEPVSRKLLGFEIVSVRGLLDRGPAGAALLMHLMQATGAALTTRPDAALPDAAPPPAAETAAGILAALQALQAGTAPA
jgi:hypothetical protein